MSGQGRPSQDYNDLRTEFIRELQAIADAAARAQRPQLPMREYKRSSEGRQAASAAHERFDALGGS